MKITRRHFLAAGGAATLGGVGYLGNMFYNAMSPSRSSAIRYGKGGYEIQAPPVRLQSSFRGKIKKSIIIENDRSPGEMQYLSSVLADNFGDVIYLGDTKAHPGVIQEEFETPALYVRDIFAVADDGSLLVSPVSEIMRRDAFNEVKKAEEILANRHGMAIKCAPFKFVGGQILKSGSYTLLPDTFRTYQHLLIDDRPRYEGQTGLLGLPSWDLSPENTWLTEEMRRHLGVQLRTVPDTKTFYAQYGMNVKLVPDFMPIMGHIDMVTTPIGGDRLLIADNTAGLEIIRNLDSAELNPYLEVATDHLRRFESEETARQFLNAFQNLRETGTSDTGTGRRYGVRGDTFRIIADDADRLYEMFPKSARIPVLIAPFVAGRGICISMAYNNAIMQDTCKEKTAIVPTFGIKALDREAMKAFERAGYRTVPVPFTEISLYGAGPHCAALEIREPARNA